MATTETTTFTQIRRTLDTAERDVVAMRQEPAKAAGVIRDVERVEALLAELRSQRVDVRAEEGRAESLHGRLVREAALVTRQVQKGGHAAELAESALWKEIQAVEAARRAAQRRNILLGAASVVLAAVLLFVVLPRVFPATPTANTIAVGQLAAQGDLNAALERALAEQAGAPDDRVIGVWIAALQQQLGRTQEAEAAWQAAQARYNNDVEFLTDRVGVELSLGDIAAAERDALTLQATPGGEALGTYQLGSVREAQRRYSEAIQIFEQAAALAEQQNKPELVVAARSRMATLMQMPQ